jgi:cytochrome c biogenesis protein
MPQARPEKNTNVIWELFRSVKLTVVLLVILGMTSSIGTLIPQGREALEFARSLSPQTFKLLSILDLFDMYHSLWFRLLIGLLTLNLVICSIDRFPGALKRFRTAPKPDRTKLFEHLPPRQTVKVPGETKDVAENVARFLRSRYRKAHIKVSDASHFFFVQKGRFSHFGVYIVHASVLVILVGALVGSFFGFEAYVNVPEGDQVDRVTLRENMARRDLGFEVRCEKFTVEFYKSGAPKEYRSDLRFLVDGKTVKEAKLLVNHPVQFRGITFYQSSYGTVPGTRVRLKIQRHGSKDGIFTQDVKVGDLVSLPGAEARFRVTDARENFMNMGPAVSISIMKDQKEEARFWVFREDEMIKRRFPGIMERFPKLNPSAYSPYTFFLMDLEGRYYTGLQVSRDPGVPLVWVGCFIMVGGFFVTFFMSHRRFWVRVSRGEKGTDIHVAGSANKNPVGLQREIEDLTQHLGNLFNQKV